MLPVLAGLLLSLTDFDVYAIGTRGTARFVGLRNYAQVLSNPIFWTALKNTLYFVLVGGPLSVSISLGAALLVSARLVRYKSLFRTIFFAPVVTTLVAVAIVWRYLYHPHYGLLNHALGLLGIGPIDWLGDPHWAMPAIILLAVWKNFGYNMLIFVAGLQSIPNEQYEAAAVDGANTWRQFLPRHATRPRSHIPVRRGNNDDWVLPALCRAICHDSGGAAEEHDERRASDVRGRIPLVADGNGLGDRLHPARDHISVGTLHPDAPAKGAPVKRAGLRPIALHAALIAAALMTLAPFAWMVGASFMRSGEANMLPPHFLPRKATLEHYALSSHDSIWRAIS